MFVTVAELGSLTRAARHLHIEQPPLSRQIAALEKEVGLELFIRSRTGMILTEFGSVLYKQAINILGESNKIEITISSAKRRINKTLCVGVSDGLHMLDNFIDSVSAMRKIDPRVVINLKQGCNENVLTMLNSGEIDIAVIWGQTEDKNTTGKKIYRGRLCAAIPSAMNENIHIIDVRNTTGHSLILPSPSRNKYLRDIICRGFLLDDSKANDSAHDVDLLSLTSIVAAGAGYSLVPDLLSAVKIKNVSYVEIMNDHLNCFASAVTRREILSPLVLTFLSQFRVMD